MRHPAIEERQGWGYSLWSGSQAQSWRAAPPLNLSGHLRRLPTDARGGTSALTRTTVFKHSSLGLKWSSPAELRSMSSQRGVVIDSPFASLKLLSHSSDRVPTSALQVLLVESKLKKQRRNGSTRATVCRHAPDALGKPDPDRRSYAPRDML